MKRLWSVMCVVVLLLCGCSEKDVLMERSLEVRSQILSARQISFHCTVTADYEDKIFSFGAQCSADEEGNITFCITEPESIANITGTLSTQGGKLTFDGLGLDFGILAQQLPSPIGGPYVLLNALRSGYIRSYSIQDGTFHMTVDESYQSDSLSVDVYFQEDNVPFYAEISQEGRKILSMEIADFELEQTV